MSNRTRLRFGKRKILRKEGLVCNYIQPSGKFWKRKASKRARKTCGYRQGSAYKKLFSWIEYGN